MRNKGTQTNIDNSDLVNYPAGRIVNNTGANNGTPVNEEVYGDLHETKDKLIRLAGIVYNDLPDNETNGYQLVEALKHLPSKNDIRYDLTSNSGVYRIALRLSKLEVGEVFDAIATSDHGSETTIASSIGDTTTKPITVVGGFKTGENLKLINLASGITIIRLVDAVNIDLVVGEFAYLKKASQVQEDAGTSDEVATTPLVNKTTFTKRVNGTDSGSYLATPSQNGLMSSADKTRLDEVVSSEKKYGNFLLGDTNGANTPVGTGFPVSGELASAVVFRRDGDATGVTITLSTPMDNFDYFVAQYVESLGDIRTDSTGFVNLTFKKVSTSQFQVYFQERDGRVQNTRIHLTIEQL